MCVVVLTKSDTRTGLSCNPGGDQPGVMGHIDEQLGPHVAGDLGKFAVRNFARIRARSGDDHLGLVLAGQRGHLVEIDAVRVARDAVVDEVIEHAGDIEPHAVRQMAAVGQVESQHCVARLQDREINGHVRLAAGMGLHIGVLGAEDLFGPIAGQIFDHVDEFAAAVIPPAGIALGVFIRQHAADRLHDGGAGVVFAGDHLQAVLLAIDFIVDRRPNLGILGFHEIDRRHGLLRGVGGDGIVSGTVCVLSKPARPPSIGG